MDDCQTEAEPPLGDHINRNVVTYVRLVELILRNNSEKKELLTKDKIVQFICKEFKISEEDLSSEALSNLKKDVNTFYYKFQRENKKKCYHTDRLLTEQWCLCGVIEVNSDKKVASNKHTTHFT